MREVVPVVVPWLVMFTTLSVSYQIEDRRMRGRARSDEATGVPLERPSVAAAVLATVLLGPLMAPIYFWRSRRRPLGLALGLRMTALSVGLYLATAMGSHAWLASDTLGRAHAACMTTGPLGADPEAAKAEGPCAAVVEAYESGTGCRDGAKLTSCSAPAVRAFSVRPDPARARALLEHRCTSRSELGACLALGERARTDAEREVAADRVRKVCCTWWQTGTCERFLSVQDCKR
ncbi:MAG: hypothetical protein HYZ29_15810 [Myxococcales bacterium]|nr:hypothetical protein [Myxococcales bacterium]